MSLFYVKKVETKREMNDFIALPRLIYAHCLHYVPDLDSDVRKAFDKKCNPGLKNCDVQPFIAYDDNQKAVGRIVGIVNHRANATWQTQHVRFGLIEMVNDQALCDALLAAVEDWGREKGMDHIEGPMGITDFDKEGMLVSDFDQTGSMVTIYNPEYYHRLLEARGYAKVVDWVQVKIRIPGQVPPRYARAAALVRQMYGVHIELLTRKEAYGEKGHEVFRLVNRAYRPLYGFTEFNDEQIDSVLKHYLPFADLRMIPTIRDNDGKLIGVAITLGSLTEALQRARGRLLPWGWFHLVRAIKFRHENKAELLLIAISPDFQGLGVNSLFFDYFIPLYNRLGYTWAETGPQLENNMKELTQWRSLQPLIYKRRRCYGKKL